jgi:hypothetical protein
MLNFTESESRNCKKIGSIAHQEMELSRKIKHECQVAGHYGDQV